jgi:Aldehyde dehydrogenase family/Binding-protein-dependent transport system inner membrane component
LPVAKRLSGSCATSKSIFGAAAHQKIAEPVGYRRLVLELGGNDPLIVMGDTDLDRAAGLAVQGAAKNSGQRCPAVKRVLVVNDVADRFAFIFQVIGALRGMSKDLTEMVFSFRPTRLKLFRLMIAPAILPGILTAWKVNLGNAARVVVVAELVGATGGVGYQLLQQQQLFDMAEALAWTLQLVFFVLIVQGALTLIENTAFRYRAVSERAL